jgi:predicted metal-dependent hydrolase
MSDGQTLDTPFGQALLIRRPRKTLAISVLPDGTLELCAPKGASLEKILVVLEKRSRWIRQQQWTFRELNTVLPARRYCSGATHRYLGRQYRLKISIGREPQVKLVGGLFQISTQTSDGNAVKKLLDRWFRERAKEQFSKRLEVWNAWCTRQGLPYPRLRLLSMPKRWGSAQKDGKICLNPQLIHAPSACVDYVIVHEVCHLKYPNHGRSFFQLLGQLCPNWRELKRRLEQAEL